MEKKEDRKSHEATGPQIVCPLCRRQAEVKDVTYGDSVHLDSIACGFCGFKQPLINLGDNAIKQRAVDWHVKHLLKTIADGLLALQLLLRLIGGKKVCGKYLESLMSYPTPPHRNLSW